RKDSELRLRHPLLLGGSVGQDGCPGGHPGGLGSPTWARAQHRGSQVGPLPVDSPDRVLAGHVRTRLTAPRPPPRPLGSLRSWRYRTRTNRPSPSCCSVGRPLSRRRISKPSWLHTRRTSSCSTSRRHFGRSASTSIEPLGSSSSAGPKTPASS